MGYNAVQKIWYARIDISEYDSIICDGLLDGSSISTSASALMVYVFMVIIPLLKELEMQVVKLLLIHQTIPNIPSWN